MSYKQKARILFNAGFEPIPVAGKKPVENNWTELKITKELIEKHEKNLPGANVGLRCGRLIGIDLDILNEEALEKIVPWISDNVVDTKFVRTGQAPKVLVACRIDELISKISSIKFEQGQIEILARGQQFVGFGIHPDTGKPYRWTSEPKGLDDLPIVAVDDLEALIDHFNEYGKERGWKPVRKERTSAPAGDPLDYQIPSFEFEELAEAVRSLPKIFADDYLEWVDVGFAIHFETRGSAEGLDLFEEFSKRSEKYSGGREIEAKWRSFSHHMDRNNITGATIMMMLKDEGISTEQVDDFFSQGQAEGAPNLTSLTPMDIRQMFTESPPAREWLIDGVIPAGQVGALVGSGGTGKSNFSLLLARCIASGVKIEPFSTGVPSRVLLMNVEDEAPDIWRRIYAQAMEYIVSPEELDRLAHNLVVYAGRGIVKPLMRKGRNQNPTPTEWAARIDELVEISAPKLVILDTRSRLFGLEENSNDDNAQWLAMIEAIAEKHGAGFLIIHHVAKSSAEKHDGGGRGASAFADNCRFVISLANLDEKQAKFYGVLDDQWKYFSMLGTKQNYTGRQKATFFERLDEGVPRVIDMMQIRHAAINDEVIFWFRTFPFEYSRPEVVKGPAGEDLRQIMKKNFAITRDQLDVVIKLLIADERLEEIPNPEQKRGQKKLLVGITDKSDESAVQDSKQPNLF